jgi:hypothetical protein
MTPINKSLGDVDEYESAAQLIGVIAFLMLSDMFIF